MLSIVRYSYYAKKKFKERDFFFVVVVAFFFHFKQLRGAVTMALNTFTVLYVI